MSVATGNKGEKAKKFQSLNINNIYQGSALKPLQKSIPTKHGLQSLGKVPTARRAPANLPSLKAEHSGNDPTINLVPSGQGASGGWSANKEEGTATNNEVPSKTINNETSTALAKNLASSVPVATSTVTPTASNAIPASGTFASSLAPKTTWGGQSASTGPFLSQRSPLFGQEFPSLTGNTESPSQQLSTVEDGRSSPPPSKNEAKYGPGPSLRPQSFATWSFGGGKQSSSNNSVDKDDGRGRSMPEHAGSLKFDVGVNSPLLQQGAPFIGRKTSSSSATSSSQRSQLVNKNPSAARPRENLFHGSIIDSEKLKRMDDIDSNDDDWTRTDDTFDYNKKLDSDEEDEFSIDRSGQSNWTDQINFSSNNRHSEPRENYVEPKASHQRGGRKAHAAHPTSAHEHNHLSFLDEEDHRLSKKNEEVLKNIERARRRRAEEEQKYHRVNDDFSERRTPNDPRRDSQHRNSPGGLENGLTKSPSSAAAFGKFDVGESEDSDKFESYDMPLSASAPSRGKLQHSSSTNSVPPRFKRHGVELHSYRRTSPPKERGQQFSGDADAGGDIRSSTSRESAENQSQEKDFGALFRPPNLTNNSWVQRRPSCSSDQAEDMSLSSTDHHMSNNGNDDKKTAKETAIGDEEATFARSSGARHSLKTKGKSEDGRSKSTKSADASKDKFGGKTSSNSKVERSSRGGQRQAANSTKNHEKRSSDQKMSANHRNRAASQQKKDEDEMASTSPAVVASNNEDSAPPGVENDGAGWFAPRGQPSRRGRGGISTSGLSRSSRSAVEAQAEGDDAASGKSRGNRKPHQREAEWDESSSDKSGGQTDDAKGKDAKRRSGDGKSHGRRDRPKKQQINRNDGERATEEEVESNRNRRGGGNSSSNRSYREDKDGGRRGGGATVTERERRDRENKQSSYERRQNKLPPRLAKQKEQNRFTGQSISTQEAWLDSSKSGENSQGPSSGVAWDMMSQQQQHQFGASTGASGPIVDYEANRALLIQRFRNEEPLVTEGGSSSLRLDSGTGLAVQSMDEAFTAESRENAVHTIIFENTNYKGSRPPLAVNNQSPSVSDGEKLMFKMPSDKTHVMGFGPGAKSEDDLKLDFTFETADVDDKPNNGKTAVNHRPTTSVSTVVATSSQPATADDLNLKIASVKKVWETLPSMSPVPGGKPGSEQSSPFAPPSSSDDKGFDTSANRFGEKESSGSMVKVRPQPHSQPPPQNGQQSAPVQPQSQQASHQRPPQVAPPQPGGQTQHNSQSIQLPSGQMHHPTHQGLLQQASLDDRLLGRGNSLAYNQLIGRSAGGLPNLQSPPSILGQQPSLYQAFQIDPNRAVTNQLYPYPPTGLGGQSLIMPPSSSSGTNNVDIFGSSSSNQFGRQFAGPPPPGSTQPSSAMSSGLNVQSGLMSSGMKGSSGIGPIGTKGAFQQGGLGSLPGSGTSPLLIPYDGGFVQNIQRSAAAAVGQTAFYQALAASSQQAAAVATSRQNNYGMSGFPGQQGLVQQQLMRNQVPPQLSNPYMKTDGKSSGQQLGTLQNRQFAAGSASTSSGQQQQSQTVKATATSFASMSLRNSVLGTVAAASTNGSAPAVSSAAAVQQSTSYSPTPIQRPPCSKGKTALGGEDDTGNLDVSNSVSAEKKLSEVED